MNGRQLAEALGVSQAHASRLRSGDRLPSMELMWAIEKVLGWKAADQMASVRAKRYHTDLSERLDAEDANTPEQQEVRA
jgi:transcriptional regulator with XRE-family HTH domain